MPTLSSAWLDVTCPVCRARLEAADHPNLNWHVGGFRSVTAGHAVFSGEFGPGVSKKLCEAPPRKPGSQPGPPDKPPRAA